MTYTAKPTEPNTHKNSRTHSHLLNTHPHPSWPLYTTYQHTQYTHTGIYTQRHAIYTHTETHATVGLGKGERIREKGGREPEGDGGDWRSDPRRWPETARKREIREGEGGEREWLRRERDAGREM